MKTLITAAVLGFAVVASGSAFAASKVYDGKGPQYTNIIDSDQLRRSRNWYND